MVPESSSFKTSNISPTWRRDTLGSRHRTRYSNSSRSNCRSPSFVKPSHSDLTSALRNVSNQASARSWRVRSDTRCSFILDGLYICVFVLLFTFDQSRWIGWTRFDLRFKYSKVFFFSEVPLSSISIRDGGGGGGGVSSTTTTFFLVLSAFGEDNNVGSTRIFTSPQYSRCSLERISYHESTTRTRELIPNSSVKIERFNLSLPMTCFEANRSLFRISMTKTQSDTSFDTLKWKVRFHSGFEPRCTGVTLRFVNRFASHSNQTQHVGSK